MLLHFLFTYVGWSAKRKLTQNHLTQKNLQTCLIDLVFLPPPFSLITLPTAQRWRPRHCVSPINPTLQAYIAQNHSVALSLEVHTEIIVTFPEFLSLDSHIITRHGSHPLLIYLCTDLGIISSLLIFWKAQTPLLLQSVKLQTYFISCHLPQQFKIIPNFKLKNILQIFPVNHCWKAAYICFCFLSWKNKTVFEILSWQGTNYYLCLTSH